MFESFWINHPSESLATKIPASRAIRQSDVNVSWCPVYGAIPAIPLPNSVWYCPPNTSTSLWVLLSPWSTGRTNRYMLCWLWYQSGYRFDSFTPHRKACDFGSEAHFEIGWQIEGSCYATHWCPVYGAVGLRQTSKTWHCNFHCLLPQNTETTLVIVVRKMTKDR